MSVTANNLQGVRRRIQNAVEGAQRDPASVTLIAVSKTFPAEAVVDAMREDQTAFGENYVQEAVEKMDRVESLRSSAGLHRPEWHFIGPIQSNKTRTIAERFDWVHSIERLKIAERLSAQRDAARGALNVLIEVNLDGEASKSGVAPTELGALAAAIARLPGLALRGLMTVPAPRADVAAQRAVFARLRELADGLRRDGLPCDHLSMGMSADLEAAIAEGATMVRVGTAIFGARMTAPAREPA
jgi:pyridoxal phosphate enzyme (YggS family)